MDQVDSNVPFAQFEFWYRDANSYHAAEKYVANKKVETIDVKLKVSSLFKALVSDVCHYNDIEVQLYNGSTKLEDSDPIESGMDIYYICLFIIQGLEGKYYLSNNVSPSPQESETLCASALFKEKLELHPKKSQILEWANQYGNKLCTCAD